MGKTHKKKVFFLCDRTTNVPGMPLPKTWWLILFSFIIYFYVYFFLFFIVGLWEFPLLLPAAPPPLVVRPLKKTFVSSLIWCKYMNGIVSVTLIFLCLMYRPFHKTLPRSSASINRNTVRFYETYSTITLPIYLPLRTH